MKLPLRIRLPLFLSVLLSCALATTGIIDIWSDEHHLVSKLESSIHEDVEWVEVKLKSTPIDEAIALIDSVAMPTNQRYAFILAKSDGTVLTAGTGLARLLHQSMPPLPGDQSEVAFNLLTPRGNFRVVDIPVKTLGGDFAWIRAMSPRTDIDEHISHMTTGKLLVKPLVVLLTAFAAYLLTKQMLSPLKSIASLAQGLTLKTPYIHLNASDSADEYDELIRILNESYSRLQDASVRISNFTSEASHELRSPIAAIRVTAENAIRQDADEFMLRQAMHEIHSESIHMTELVSQLLALSRLESSERNSLCETVRVDYILESLSDRYTCLASESFVGFSMNSVVPFEVRGDRVHLRQMFTNLIDNAFKFTPAGGAISVTSRVDGAVWRLRIVDTGIGISKEHMPRVFDRFFRANPFGKQGNNGSGLGLPLCRAIATIHGGNITAESEVGTGSVFEVSLPGTPPVDDDERFYLDESHTRIAETEETHLTFERSPSDS